MFHSTLKHKEFTKYTCEQNMTHKKNMQVYSSKILNTKCNENVLKAIGKGGSPV